MSARWKIRFRTSITGAVLAFIFGLAALLIAIQARTLRLATHQAASAYMDATSAQVFGRLRSEITAVVSLVHVLASSSSVADSDAVSNSSPELSVFKTAILELPQIDSIYVGFANGAWLQVRQANALNDEQRQKLRVTSPDTDFLINVLYLRVQDRFQFKPLASVTAKGMTKETAIFELIAAKACSELGSEGLF
jgi:adenylate cyclase